MLIADFAPHELEFLRDDYAHRRLGFSDREVEGWFAGAGLKAGDSETIAPGIRRAADKLTVKYGWLPPKARPRKAQRGGMSLQDMIAQRTAALGVVRILPAQDRRGGSGAVAAIKRLEPLQPGFVSVTYGAGGSTRERTHATVKRIVEETSLKPAAHLTCVGASRGEIDEIVRGYWDAGIRHIVALRGDMPGMDGPYQPHPEGYRSTPELIAGIRRIAPFEVSVSFYPERHPDSPSHGHDIELAESEDGCGRQPRAGPILLRQ